jgi:hypothetical protein
MGKFLESEKPKQIRFKLDSGYFSSQAKQDGFYKGHPYPFSLPRECAEENLFSEIREPIMAYFSRNEIKWHDGQDGKPSNHMCDSQVCCANFLFPFADKPEALAALLSPIFPTLERVLPIEDGLCVAFEWIGAENYLQEKLSRNAKRTRGANFTSADAAVMFQHSDGRKQIVLIEWKYTESYSNTNLEIAESGTSRADIYRHLYDRDDCPLDKKILPTYESLFYEPFYQLMRQQFLAHEMEKAHELGVSKVSLMHISPAHNLDFKKVTSSNLTPLGDAPTTIWERVVVDKENFHGTSTEELFGKFLGREIHRELREWARYILTRYKWIVPN